MKDIKAEATGRKTIKFIDSIVNIVILVIVVLLAAFAGYALWDSKQIFNAADKSNYELYKPTAENEGKSFRELQDLNPEVVAWLSVYGTNIDYPVTQGEDNIKYVNTNAEGRYSLSGAIFLDYLNSKDFSDFNSILYGHHMEREKMFGEIESFSNKRVFESHHYGNLYFDGKGHGIEFFAFVKADAYDRAVFTPGIKEKERRVYLAGLLEKAVYIRDIDISDRERIILLTTCSNSFTNGRDILVGKVTDEVFDDPFAKSGNKGSSGSIRAAGGYCCISDICRRFVLFAIVLLAVIIILITVRRRGKRH